MNKKCAAELLEAQNEETSHERLAELWSTSRSVKVRKAVASNPNASPSVLKEAARLYLEEVVQNPGFEMLHLFDAGDSWIREIAAAYNDPDAFIMSHGLYYWSRGNVDSYLKACLLSKKLSAISLNRVVESIPKASLRRTIKNPEVREHVRYIVISQLKSLTTWHFDLGSIMVLYMENIISKEELKLCLTNYSQGSSSAKKSSYTAFITQLQTEYLTAKTVEDKNEVAELLGRVIIISRSHALNWLYSPFESSALLEWSGELYSKIFKLIANGKIRRGLITENVRWVGGVVVSYLKVKFLAGREETARYSRNDLEQMFEFIKKYNLTGERFGEFGLLLHWKDVVDELANCSLEVKEFFARAGCLGSWVSTCNSDSKYAIVEEVNNAIYERDGITSNLLFNKCSVRKIVALDDTTHIY